jgi:hypothetical protein
VILVAGTEFTNSGTVLSRVEAQLIANGLQVMSSAVTARVV